MSVDECDGVELSITDYQVRDGRFGHTAHVLCADVESGEMICVRTTSTVVQDQLERIKDHLPLVGSFRTEKNYHILQ
jgi:hypothetical protein